MYLLLYSIVVLVPVAVLAAAAAIVAVIAAAADIVVGAAEVVVVTATVVSVLVVVIVVVVVSATVASVVVSVVVSVEAISDAPALSVAELSVVTGFEVVPDACLSFVAWDACSSFEAWSSFTSLFRAAFGYSAVNANNAENVSYTMTLTFCFLTFPKLNCHASFIDIAAPKSIRQLSNSAFIIISLIHLPPKSD